MLSIHEFYSLFGAFCVRKNIDSPTYLRGNDYLSAMIDFSIELYLDGYGNISEITYYALDAIRSETMLDMLLVEKVYEREFRHGILGNTYDD